MKTVEKQAKTVEEAIELALKELGIDKEDAEIEVLEEGSKGILGFLSKAAKVRVTKKENLKKKAINFLEGLLSHFDADPKITVVEDEEQLKINLEGKRVGVLIGKHGSTLDALQYLTSLVVNRDAENRKRIVLDAENYRARRQQALEKLAERMAKRVMRTKKSVVLEPMLPNERRIIHTVLQNYEKVATKSIGEEPNRRVVISMK